VQLGSVDRAASYSSYELHLSKSRNSVIKSHEIKNNAEFQSLLITLSNAHMYNCDSKGTVVLFLKTGRISSTPIDIQHKSFEYSRVSSYDGVTFSNILL